jgi:hypothetical protein
VTPSPLHDPFAPWRNAAKNSKCLMSNTDPITA